MSRAADARSAKQSTVWLHASLPEKSPVLAVLAEQLADFKTAPTVIQTGTATALGPARDDPAAIDQFIADHTVRLLVLVGTEIPVTILERACANGVTCFLADAKHPVVPARWRFVPGNARAALSRFAQIHAQDKQSAAVLTRLVRNKAEVFETGPMARFAPTGGCNAFELNAMRESLGARPVWFAYDLPEPEVDAALLAHAQALRRAHRLLMILQPRDPHDGALMAERAHKLGFACARRMLEEEISENTQVYIADAEDDPGLFLRLAPVSFLGGSLTQNAGTPSAVAAAALGSALIFGPLATPDKSKFLEQLCAIGGGRQIGVAAALGDALATILAPDVGAEAALKAWTLATDGSEATYRVAQAIVDWMQLSRERE